MFTRRIINFVLFSLLILGLVAYSAEASPSPVAYAAQTEDNTAVICDDAEDVFLPTVVTNG